MAPGQARSKGSSQASIEADVNEVPMEALKSQTVLLEQSVTERRPRDELATWRVILVIFRSVDTYPNT